MPQQPGLCVVANVYQGMEGVKPGEVKGFRSIVAAAYWSNQPAWGRAGQRPLEAALWPRVQWGVVPVEKKVPLISWCRPTAARFFSGPGPRTSGNSNGREPM